MLHDPYEQYRDFEASLRPGDQPRIYDPRRTAAVALAELHDGIREGDVLAFRSHGFFSWLIRKWTDSRVSHVAFAIRVRGVLCALEAREGRGVQIFPLSRYVGDADPNTHVDWHRLQAEKFHLDRKLLIAAALEHWGEPYASPLQFLRSFGFLTRWAADWLHVPVDLDRERFFCSEFVLMCLRRAGYLGDPQFLEEQTTPGDVIELACLERATRVA